MAEGGGASARRQAVERARTQWLARLIDKSRRNNLLYFRDLKSGTLDMTQVSAEAMTELLMGKEVPLRRFYGRSGEESERLRSADARLTGIRAKALANSEERGIETLYMAMGMASWQPRDEGRVTEAAMLLVPLKARKSGRGGQGLSLVRNGDIQPNLVLLHVLEEDFRISLTPEELLRDLQGDDEGETFDLGPVEQLLRARCANLPGFTTSRRVVIGNFAFQKIAMVHEMRNHLDELIAHDLVAALAGDPEARSAQAVGRVSVDPREWDRVPPDHEFLILDADSSQQTVIGNALRGQSGVIQGPPGTGKSQTIANLIAEFAAAGKRVLFVSEKRAALQVVLDRLEKRGLGHLALDLHGAEVSRQDVMVRLQESLEQVNQPIPEEPVRLHDDFVRRRRVLLDHLERMHQPRTPTGLSVYRMQGRLLRLGGCDLHTRWHGEALAALTPARISEACEGLRTATLDWDLFLRTSTSPWTGARLDGAEGVRSALQRVDAVVAEGPAVLQDVAERCARVGLRFPTRRSEVEVVFDRFALADGVCEEFDTALFAEPDLAEWPDRLAPARGSALRRAWAFVSDGAYRSTLRRLRAHWRGDPCDARQLEARLTATLEVVERWRAAAVSNESFPAPSPGWREVQARWTRLSEHLSALEGVLVGFDGATIPLQEALDRAQTLSRDRATASRVAKLYGLEQRLEDCGVREMVEECRRIRPAPERIEERLEAAWLASSLDEIEANDLELATFRGVEHDQVVQEFRQLDRQRIQYAAGRVRATHTRRAIAAMNDHRDQEDLLRVECQKKRGKSVRRLLGEAPEVLTALRPCWMASPLSVSQLLPVRRDLFDVVLFDEASQVLPEDAMPALLRAPYAVVAGDRHQLPPTQFFVGGDELEDESAAEAESASTQDFESILDQMSGLFPEWTLDWHYRSLDESLIAFSNHHIYGDRLVTFPGAGRERALEHHVVPPSPTEVVSEESAPGEVRKVVELVMRHATERPGESLGVITLGITHQRRIEKHLEAETRNRPELDGFFDESRRERFFIKNLERVQGDERDAIILSIGYGMDRSGALRHSFGPLTHQGGERRLNVAITRARKRLALVSSFGHHDMDPARGKARGVHLMREYLQYAASGGRVLGEARSTTVPLNDFEADVFAALQAKGLSLEPQWGVSRYRIDMVARHPAQPGRFVLAIECDGASYHSAHTARDRDRLRQQHLEALGWRFHRIWSTDWFLRRDEEIARVVTAYERAVARASEDDDGPASASVAAPTSPPALAGPARERAPLPININRDAIDRYVPSELVALVAWVMSDQRPRTDSQLLDEMVDLLDFKRGSRIVERIETAIRTYRGMSKDS
jgi:very-short-patch-repair endonuclease